MPLELRLSSIAVTAGFLGIIAAVPLAQVGWELSRGGPIQATDLFRQRPSVSHLRQFEADLEAQSWGQRLVRPLLQRVAFVALGEVGAKAVVGRDGWLFYRPGIRYLAEPDRRDPQPTDSLWVEPDCDRACRDNVVDAIVTFHDQLQQRGVQLLVVPVPGKASLYPEMVTRRMADRDAGSISPTASLLATLDRQGIATVDLLAALRHARARAPFRVDAKTYYLARDTHWTPAGVSVAADAIAAKLRELGWTTTQEYEYQLEPRRVVRHGDIPQMLQRPGVADWFPAEHVDCIAVIDPIAGPLVPRPDGRPGTFQNDHLIDTPMEAGYLLLGDSFSRIYQTAEPASLGRTLRPGTGTPQGRDRASDESDGQPDAVGAGRAKKRQLPGSAGLPSQLARELKAAVNYIVSDGGAATNVRRQLAVNPEIFERQRVVIWEFAERDIGLGRQGWAAVPLPESR